MIELVFVIVVVGILSYFVSAGFQRNTSWSRRPVSDTYPLPQHLAMMDDKFDPNDATWYQTRYAVLILMLIHIINGHIQFFPMVIKMLIQI